MQPAVHVPTVVQQAPGPVLERMGLARNALTGQVALVTGGRRGIGLAVAGAFAWAGAHVVIADVTDAGTDTEHLLETMGGSVRFVQRDISSESDVARLVQEVDTTLGAVDILINNAAIEPVASVVDMEVSLWDRVIAVNLRGTFLTCKALLPRMLARRHGTIVNMISTEAMPYLSAYIASKQGIAGFSQSLAAEVGEQGIRVIALAPGFVDTPGLREAGTGLAPHLGMTPDQFLHLSLHPAYEGPMPAEHAAAATVYLVVKLAEVYHGELVTGYTVLERAGVIAASPGAAPVSAASPVASGAVPSPMPSTMPATSHDEVLMQAVAASLRLQAIIAQTEADFGKLPIFVRPMARHAFQDRTGQSSREWTQTAQRLTDQLTGMQHADRNAADGFLSAASRVRDQLTKLAAYYEEVPGETARFTKDPEVLRTIDQTTAERVRTIRSLLVALEALLPPAVHAQAAPAT